MQKKTAPETIADLLATTVSRWRAGAVPDAAHVAAIATLARVSEARVRRALLATAANAL